MSADLDLAYQKFGRHISSLEHQKRQTKCSTRSRLLDERKTERSRKQITLRRAHALGGNLQRVRLRICLARGRNDPAAGLYLISLVVHLFPTVIRANPIP